jgi:hypothetical protein
VSSRSTVRNNETLYFPAFNALLPIVFSGLFGDRHTSAGNRVPESNEFKTYLFLSLFVVILETFCGCVEKNCLFSGNRP